MSERDSIRSRHPETASQVLGGLRRMSLWHRALILSAVLSLAVNVATRYTTVVQQKAAAKVVSQHSVDAKRQHLLNDGLHWSAPAAKFVLFRPAGASTTALPPVPRVSRFDSESLLYSRPPPSC